MRDMQVGPIVINSRCHIRVIRDMTSSLLEEVDGALIRLRYVLCGETTYSSTVQATTATDGNIVTQVPSQVRGEAS